jgi:hypothetical protein
MEYLVNRLLERSAVKVARSVLRGGRWSNPPALPDIGLPGFRGKLAGGCFYFSLCFFVYLRCYNQDYVITCRAK